MFVERGNPLRAKQEMAFMYFLDFVDECEGKMYLCNLSYGYLFFNIDREVLTADGNVVLTKHILIFLLVQIVYPH